MTDIQAQYSTGASRQAIERALVAAGKDLGHLQPADLALLEDFHTMGRIATTQLADDDAQPVIGVAGCRTQGREGCSVARALQPSVVVVEDVDLIGEERSLRDRVPQSLPGPRSPRSRSSVDTPQSERSLAE